MRPAILLALLLALPAGCLDAERWEERASPILDRLDRDGKLVNLTVYNDAGKDVRLRVLFDDEEILQRTFRGGSNHGDLHESVATFRWNGTRVAVRAEDLTHDHATTFPLMLDETAYVAVVVYESRVEVREQGSPFAWM